MGMFVVYHLTDDKKEIQFADGTDKKYALAYANSMQDGSVGWFVDQINHMGLTQTLYHFPPIIEGAISLSMGDWVVRK